MTKQTPKQLNSVAAVIKALGGQKAIAKLTGVGVTTVSNWNVWGYIPSSWYFVFSTLLTAKGYRASPDVFGFRRLDLSDKQIAAIERLKHGDGRTA